jgi:phage tail-like protein
MQRGGERLMVTAERPAAYIDTSDLEVDSILAAYLPGILRQDPFLANFLRVFDSMLRPLLETLDSIDSYFDPGLTPPDMIPWLGSWLGEEFPSHWPASVRRALLREAATIHRARGTKFGLKRALELVTGREVLVMDNASGLRLDEEAKLGINSSLELPDLNSIHIVINGGSGIDLRAVTQVIQQLKPAHAVFSIRITDE